MKRFILALVLTGCATAPTPEFHPPPMESGPDEAILVQSLTQQQQTLTDELLHPAAESHAPECDKVCALSANICGLSGRICAITARHDGDEELSRACNDALDRCSRARATTGSSGCTCTP